MMGVYSIVNLVNNKVYIGSSVDLLKRKSRHINSLRSNSNHNIHLQRSWNKYGENYFEFNTVEILEDKASLIEREQYWIDFYKSFDSKSGYNICRIAGSMLGFRFSPESKRLLSEIRRGYKHSEVTKKKISESHKGKVMNFSNEYKVYLSERMKGRTGDKNPFYGKKHSEETRRKISEANIGKTMSDRQKEAIIRANTNRIISEETREKLSKRKRKENLSNETIEKLRVANKGSKNPNAKLNEDSVVEIKLLLKDKVTHQEIASRFGVSRALIGNIKNNKAWSHIDIDGGIV